MTSFAPSSAIYFYSHTDKYGEFSNFAPYGIEKNDKWWPTTEHYFQAQKFKEPAYQERIRMSDTPEAAKVLGKEKKHLRRSDWENIKEQIMLDAVRIKFRTHEVPRRLLLSTCEYELIENAPMDAYWGCGKDGSGLNKLGKILMQVRSELR